jgi:hypothetical protein
LVNPLIAKPLGKSTSRLDVPRYRPLREVSTGSSRVQGVSDLERAARSAHRELWETHYDVSIFKNEVLPLEKVTPVVSRSTSVYNNIYGEVAPAKRSTLRINTAFIPSRSASAESVYTPLSPKKVLTIDFSHHEDNPFIGLVRSELLQIHKWTDQVLRSLGITNCYTPDDQSDFSEDEKASSIKQETDTSIPPLPSQEEIQQNWEESVQRVLNKTRRFTERSEQSELSILDVSEPESLETVEIPTPKSQS